MKLKIKNRKKFITSTSILLTILFILLSLLYNKTYSNTYTQYQEKIICKGDTLWTIAENEKNNNKYFDGKDIRYIVYEIQNLNNLKDNYLQIGDTVLVPTYKSPEN